MSRLIVLAGLPGVGKTTLARALAKRLGAVHLRIDTIEQALGGELTDEGYRVAYGVAEDNLRLGLDVVADSVNPIALTRQAWRAAAARAGAELVELEVVCGDPGEHRRRVETRQADIAGHRLPTWREVVERDYQAFDPPIPCLDTATADAEALAEAVCRRLGHPV